MQFDVKRIPKSKFASENIEILTLPPTVQRTSMEIDDSRNTFSLD